MNVIYNNVVRYVQTVQVSYDVAHAFGRYSDVRMPSEYIRFLPDVYILFNGVDISAVENVGQIAVFVIKGHVNMKSKVVKCVCHVKHIN